MPQEGDRSHEDYRRKRNHSSSSTSSRSSHHHHKHSGSSAGGRQRDHRRHRPYSRERAPRSSTRIYFNGSNNTPSVSLHTDHVTLASNLSSLVKQREVGGMLQIFEDCCQMFERLRQDQATNSAVWPGVAPSTSSYKHLGANQSNLVAIPKSPAKKSKPSFSKMMEERKATSLVPAIQTKQMLQQRLSSHSEAKLESIDISLFCPLTHSRIVTPVRGKNCQHVHCFDGEAFCNLMWEKPISKWKCPICKCLTPLSALVVDGFIVEILASVSEDIRSVEFTSNGIWRIKDSAVSQPVGTPPVSGQEKNKVIDLTLDSPMKLVNQNSSQSSRNLTPQVIDLTLSP